MMLRNSEETQNIKKKYWFKVISIFFLFLITIAILLTMVYWRDGSKKIKNEEIISEDDRDSDQLPPSPNTLKNEADETNNQLSQTDKEEKNENELPKLESFLNKEEIREEKNDKDLAKEQTNSSKQKSPQILNFFSTSSKKLLESCEGNLLRIINELENGYAGGGKRKSSNETFLLNKAKIFKFGLDLQKKYTDKKNLQHDLLRIVTSSDVNAQFPIKKFTELKTSKYSMDYSGNLSKRKRNSGEKVTFVCFDNHISGGSWRGGGNVQGEQMALEIPLLALLLSFYNPYHPDFNSADLVKRNLPPLPSSYDGKPKLFTRKPETILGNEKFAHDNSANPFLITNLVCLLEPQKGSDAFNLGDNNYDPKNKFNSVRNPEVINIVAMAAPELQSHERGKEYLQLIINDLFEQAYQAFSLVKNVDQKNRQKSHIQTGWWACGAFKHNKKMSAYIQYMAARLARIEKITFNLVKTQEDEKIIKEAKREVDGWLSDAQLSKNKLLKKLEEKKWKTNS